ncbi:MAG: isoprenoid biosynthesis glyoxalase ElbB [Bdellovibrionaceae bacterium]|nr:isoprenoid biosynthesis glyoxalase ElbB [Pseudobdellovibrionaceae bacterium]
MSTKRIALVLSGCGNKDGSEITETVALIVGLSRKGAELHFFAPDQNFQSLNFLTNENSGERNMMIEGARIARSKIKPLKELNADGFDALVFPGGAGAARNLSSWHEKGAQCVVNVDVRRVIEEFYKKELPIAAVCIAPVLLARVLGPKGITITLGADNEATAEARKTGANVETCPVDDYITDRVHKIITTPAYMHGDSKPHQVYDGIQGLTQELLEMA